MTKARVKSRKQAVVVRRRHRATQAKNNGPANAVVEDAEIPFKIKTKSCLLDMRKKGDLVVLSCVKTNVELGLHLEDIFIIMETGEFELVPMDCVVKEMAQEFDREKYPSGLGGCIDGASTRIDTHDFEFYNGMRVRV